MDDKEKAKLSKEERKSRKFGNDEKIKNYQISQISKKQGVTFDEAEIIYNQRVKQQFGRKKKKSSNKKRKETGAINSVYTSLDGVTGARTWKKVK